MRGRVHGGGRGRGARDLSPLASARVKDSRSNWHHDRYDRRPYRLSLSPPSRDRSRRTPVRRSTSIERQDYASRRSDYEKHLRNEPPPLLEPRGLSSPFRHDDYELTGRVMLTGDPSNLNPEVNSSVLSRANKEFLPLGNGTPGTSSLGLESQGTLHQKRLLLDDGSTRTFYSLSSDTNYAADAALQRSENTGRSRGLLDVGSHDYHDRLRNPYDERHGGKAYTKDASFASPLMRSYGGATSSNLPKSDLLCMYDDHLRRPQEGFNRDGPIKYLDDTLDRVGYGQMQLSEPMRQDSPSRIEPQYRGYDQHNQRENNSRGYIGSDGMYEKMPWGSHNDYRDKIGSSVRERVGVRIGDLGTSRNVTSESSMWNKHRSLHGNVTLEYSELKGINGDYVDFVDSSANEHLGYKVKPSRIHDLGSVEETYAFGPSAVPSYKERPTSPLYFEHRRDIYGEARSPRGESEIDDVHQFSSERITRRKYGTDNYISELEPRTVSSNDRAAYRMIASPEATDDRWSEEDLQGFGQSKRMALDHSKYKQISPRVPRSVARLSSGGTFRHEEHGHGMSIKRRLRPGPSVFHAPYNSDKREFFRPYKHYKKNRHDNLTRDGDDLDNSDTQKKVDPPEGSEEFKQQIQKAFLRFFKVLNENPEELKRYREQGQGSSLQCLVCGSTSEFKETHNLVNHLYRSGKVGLKTEHLGLHKALCLLVGWNWLVAPDNSRNYQSTPAADAESLKEDLILWPPVIILHNNSIVKKVGKGEQKSLSTGSVQEILKELGFETSKTTISQGKPGSCRVFLIKFVPTFSGLQEAERLHKHFVDNHRGKEEFQKRSAIKSSAGNTTHVFFKKFSLLYGYMAVPEDLPKLDSETRKRCLVRSKKDIEAIADAPLNVD